jgi:hypothetical protein
MGQLAVIAWLLGVAMSGGATHGRRRFAWLLYAIPLAAVLAALELQRGIGLIVLGVILATAIVAVVVNRGARGTLREEPRRTSRLLMVAVLCLPLYLGSMALASRLGATMPDDKASAAMLRYTTAHASSLSNGSYAWMVPFHGTFAESFVDDPDRGADFRRSLVLSDFLEDPLGRATNAATRLKHLYLLGGSFYFYTAGYADRHPESTRVIRSYVNAFAFLFALGALLAIANLLIRPRVPVMAFLLLLLAAAVTLSLVLLAENQPRYLYLIWFVGAATIGIGFARSRPRGQPGLPPSGVFKRTGAVLLQTILVLSVGLAVAWSSTAPWFDEGSGRIISGWEIAPWPALSPAEDLSWRSSLDNAPSDVLADAHSRYGLPAKQFGRLALTVSLPRNPVAGDRVEASRIVCPGGTTRDDLAFFVYTPYKHLRRRGSFSLDVSVDGDRRWSLPLPYATKAVPVEIPNLVPPGKCSRLTFTLRSNLTNDRASWKRASRVEIYFPRLVDATP